MRISSEKLRDLCDNKGLSLSALLERAGVSRTAYYALARKEDVLPHSIRAIADALETKPSVFLEEGGREQEAMRSLIEDTEAIARAHPELDLENIRHTLLMLTMKPIDRLRRGLIRGRKIDIH